MRPVNQFTTQGVFVTNVTASSLSSGVAKKGRKTLLVSGAEVGDPPAIKTPPKSSLLTNTKLKGKFGFTAPKDVLVPLAGTGTDLVTMSASFELPEGFDTSAKQEIDLGIGNIVDIVMIDAKGKGTVPAPAKSSRNCRSNTRSSPRVRRKRRPGRRPRSASRCPDRISRPTDLIPKE